ncbi:MAG: hypothetical protein QOI11_840 [Candidatus Eremiobacteraeota bacterium]|nr:hypothetical protein [Candidatus Eremiobacteraeota bacterium]
MQPTTGAKPQTNGSSEGGVASDAPPRSALARFGKPARALLTVLAVLVVVALAARWYFGRPPRSIQAYVNAAVTTVQTPVAGQLAIAAGVDVGRPVRAGQPLATVISTGIANPRSSDLRVQREALRAQIETSSQHLASLRAQIAGRSGLADTFAQEGKQQHQLDTAYAAAQLHAAQAASQQAVVQNKLAAIQARRTASLYATGDISADARDQAATAAAAAEARTAAANANRAGLSAAQRAAQAGLEVGGGRSLSYAEIRVRELGNEITDLRQQLADESTHQAALRQQLRQLDGELSAQSRATLTAPVDGVIWSLDAHNGQSVGGASAVAEIVSCSDVWVDAFFDESAATRLHVGQDVQVRDVNGKPLAPGHVETIRAGAGRVTVGHYVVDPPPEIEHRQLPVRVSTVRVGVDWPKTDQRRSEFCRAGSSVTVVADRG